MCAPSVERGGGENGWADGLTGGALRAGPEPLAKTSVERLLEPGLAASIAVCGNWIERFVPIANVRGGDGEAALGTGNGGQKSPVAAAAGATWVDVRSVRGTRRRENGWADGLTAGALRAGLNHLDKKHPWALRRAAPGAGLGRFHCLARGTEAGGH